MRLVAFEVENYRRFRARNKINLDSEVLAIVGPNEAGKSSLLQALSGLNTDEPFSYSEMSRGTAPSDQQEIVRARFLLEHDDFKLLEDVPGGVSTRWLVVGKQKDGSQSLSVEPALRRDIRPRQRLIETIARLNRSKWRQQLDTEQYSEEMRLLDEVLERLNTEEESLEDDAVEAMDQWASALRELFNATQVPKYAADLPERLEALRVLEAESSPGEVAATRLWDASPLIVLFNERERTLSSEYELEDVATNPPPALQNLSNLAELDLEELLNAINQDDFARAGTLLTRANAVLDSVFHEAWRQSQISVNFSHDGTVLRLFARDHGGNYTSIAERSDGMRAFVALIAFVSTQPEGHPPILLVDEAETHLHYDAQADLVRMFSKQEAVAQVIYTTHSAGCLPQDLGTGVRLVVPVDDEDSRTVDHFWAEGPGFTPLLIGMGASSLAFTPTRFALIAEGPTEVVLLPTLFRLASGIEDVGFQVAPGLSAATADAIESLEFEAVRVAYLVDGDAGGRAIRRKLIGTGIPEDRVISLAEFDSDLTIEDFLNPVAYAAAVNEELRRSHGTVEMPASVVEVRTKRAAAVTTWCRRRSINPPNKVAVAYRVLERRREIDILDRRRKSQLTAVHKEVFSSLGIKAPRKVRSTSL